jgi:hypothetical protein
MKTKRTTKAKATKKAFVSPAVKAFKKAIDKAAQAPTPKVNATKVAKAYMQVMGATEATYDDGRGNVTTVKATDPKVMVAKLDAAIAAADQAVAAQAKAKPSKAKALKFSRHNQPVACRSCGKKTTFSEVNGNVGLDLCQKCFDAAGAENERLDGHAKVADVAPVVAAKGPKAEALTTLKARLAKAKTPVEKLIVAGAAEEAKAAPLKMRLYAKGKTGGQFYFPVAAAKTLNGHGWVTITANGKLVTITPTQGEAKKVQENQASLPLTYSHGNPQVMATKVLALTGWNNTTQDLAITLVKGSLQVEVK